MNNAEKNILDQIKKQMKEHGLVSYKVGVFEGYIGRASEQNALRAGASLQG